jgi:uncharacterized protein YggU (UPF0235/DUF167 family)
LDRNWAFQDAANIKSLEQLTPVERRAVEILKGKRQRSKKHPIEGKAVILEPISKLPTAVDPL